MKINKPYFHRDYNVYGKNISNIIDNIYTTISKKYDIHSENDDILYNLNKLYYIKINDIKKNEDKFFQKLIK